MTTFDENQGIRIVGFAIPVEIAQATRAAAKADMTTMSDIMRRALIAELKNRGFLRTQATA